MDVHCWSSFPGDPSGDNGMIDRYTQVLRQREATPGFSHEPRIGAVPEGLSYLLHVTSFFMCFICCPCKSDARGRTLWCSPRANGLSVLWHSWEGSNRKKSWDILYICMELMCSWKSLLLFLTRASSLVALMGKDQLREMGLFWKGTLAIPPLGHLDNGFFEQFFLGPGST